MPDKCWVALTSRNHLSKFIPMDFKFSDAAHGLKDIVMEDTDEEDKRSPAED